jgi:hypothetical protein
MKTSNADDFLKTVAIVKPEALIGKAVPKSFPLNLLAMGHVFASTHAI